MTEPVTVIIADDHPLFRRGLVDVLSGDGAFRVVGEAADGDDALAMIRRLRPRVALLDIHMPGMSGLAVAAAIGAETLPVAVVILTMYGDRRTLGRALDTGAKGYVLKDSAVTEIIACLHTVSTGRAYVSPALSTELLERRSETTEDALDVRLSELTPAERKVLQRIAAGFTSAEIADDLGNSIRTIENHRSHICRKLGLKGPQALLRFALERKARLE